VAVETKTSEIIKVEDNVLTIDYIELTMGKYKKEPMYYYTASNHIWQKHGYPDNPWVSSSQFKTELADANTFGKGTGFKVCYPFEVQNGFEADSVKMVIERPWLYTIKFNNKVVEAYQWRRWLDPDFHVFEIGGLVQEGRNEVTIEASPFSIFCELQPIYILGDFNLESVEKGWKVINKTPLEFGSWKNQGMPFYGQTISYKKTINVKVQADYIFKLPDWRGTVAEIKIDGEHAGIIQSEPNEFKTVLKYGIHDIEVVVNGSNKNLLGPHHNIRSRGIVTPWSFKFAPEVQPAGKEYDLLDYGLIQDFEVYKMVD